MSKFLNDKPIEHTSSNLTRFTCDRGDLQSEVNVEYSSGISEAQKLADFAEFGAWHRGYIWPNLNGFQGHDCINFKQN